MKLTTGLTISVFFSMKKCLSSIWSLNFWIGKDWLDAGIDYLVLISSKKWTKYSALASKKHRVLRLSATKVSSFKKVQWIFQISKSLKKYSKSLSWPKNLNFLPKTVHNLFKFHAQDSDLEYFFLRDLTNPLHNLKRATFKTTLVISKHFKNKKNSAMSLA